MSVARRMPFAREERGGVEEQLRGLEYRTFHFGEECWEELLEELDEDEARAAEAIRRLREGK